MQCFEIAFSGELVEGARVEVVKANLAKLFQADEQRIALLFSGRRVVIKSGLDAAGAEKYRMTLERAGARVEVCDLSAEVEEIELADQVGLDVFGLGEHHRPDYAVSAPAVVLAAAATRTLARTASHIPR